MTHKEIIEKMTLEQKAALLTGKNFWETQGYEDLGVKSIFLSDGPHGIRKQADAADHLGLNASIPATCFPTAATMANSWNAALGEEMGVALGEECAAQKVNMLLGPGTCMKRNPRCGRNFEYFSEDPYLAGKMAAAYIRGIQENGTSACVKHFAANNQEERRMSTDSVMDERTLREIYLTAFEIAVKEGKTKSIMTAYNKVNGTYANENMHLLRDILRGEWGFEGVVVSDWAGSNDRVAAVKAGSDIEMPACRYGADDVVKAVNDGTLDIALVDECVERILTLIDSTTAPGKTGEKGFDVQAHNEIARRCAEESIVLLKNDGALPLNNQKRVAVIGDFAKNPRYQGAGSSIVNPTVLSRFVNSILSENVKNAPKNKTYKQGVGTVVETQIKVVESIVEDVSEYNINAVGYEQGFNRYGKKDEGLKKKALALAENADTVLLFLGLDEVSEAEGLDREHLKINDNQIELYKALKALGKEIIIVLSCGSAVEIDFLSDANALVYACLSGQACADAILNVITGKVNPSGKLAETFPVKYEDTPTVNYFPGKMLTVEYREGPFIGYRYYEKAGVKVEYPFGFGLSYTQFEYLDLEVSASGVSFTLKNVGKVAGAEVSQLYIGKKDSKIIRPVKELKGFAKTYLEAGESKKVTIPFDDKSFRYFNVKTDKWEVEGGEYEIYVAAAISDVKLCGAIQKEGTTDVLPYDISAFPSYASGKVKNVSDEEFKALLGREIPKAGYTFYKKNRMVIDENCTVNDLRYSKRWVGRAFSGGVRFGIKFLTLFGNKTMANTLVMGVKHQPVRGLAKFGGMSRRQMEGMITMFNGKFFKGLGMILFKEKKNK